MNLLNVNLQDSINLGKFKKFVFIKCFYFFRLKKVKKGKYVHFGHHLVFSWKVEDTKKKPTKHFQWGSKPLKRKHISVSERVKIGAFTPMRRGLRDGLSKHISVIPYQLPATLFLVRQHTILSSHHHTQSTSLFDSVSHWHSVCLSRSLWLRMTTLRDNKAR